MKKTKTCSSAKKQTIKHLNEDIHESRESIADDKKLKKKLRKSPTKKK